MSTCGGAADCLHCAEQAEKARAAIRKQIEELAAKPTTVLVICENYAEVKMLATGMRFAHRALPESTHVSVLCEIEGLPFRYDFVTKYDPMLLMILMPGGEKCPAKDVYRGRRYSRWCYGYNVEAALRDGGTP